MQSGGGNGRSPSAAAPPSSSSASPSSSSSASIQQQQQQQQIALRQSLQHQHQQKLRKAEGEENLLAYKAVGIHGVLGGNNGPSSGAIPTSQPVRKFNDIPHQHGSQFRDDNQNKGQGLTRQVQNPVHQAYLQFALQNAQQQKSHGDLLVQQQGRFNIVGSAGRDQDMRVNNLKMQDLMSRQSANQAQSSTLKKSEQHFGSGEKQIGQGHSTGDQRNELKAPHAASGQFTPAASGQFTPANIIRPVQPAQSQASIENLANNQLLMAQLQAMQAWAMEHNVDLSLPANANLIAQILPIWQSSRLNTMQKPNEASTAGQQSCFSSAKQHVMSSPVGSETSAHGNSLSELSGWAGPAKSRQTLPSGSIASSGVNTLVNSNSIQIQQQLAVQSRENQNERGSRPPITTGNRGAGIHPPQSSGSSSIDHSNAKNKISGEEALQMQHLKQMPQLNRSTSQPPVPSNEVGCTSQTPSQGAQVPNQHTGFTKQQLHVLKAQILAFRRLKRGERTLPQEVLQSIAPPPLDSQSQQVFPSTAAVNQERTSVKNVEEHTKRAEVNEKVPQLTTTSRHGLPKEEPVTGEEKTDMVGYMKGAPSPTKEPVLATSSGKLEETSTASIKSEQGVERESQMITAKGDYTADKGKIIPTEDTTVDSVQVKKPVQTSGVPLQKEAVSTRKYHGPLFDFPFFTRRPDSFGQATTNNQTNLTFAYDVKDLLFEEGVEVLNKKRRENLKKISGLLAVNLERKRIRPDLVLRLQIEQKKLRLLDLQARLREEVDQEQQEIMAMSDRPYRKFVKQCERQRVELIRQVQQLQKVAREKQLKSIFQWRKKLLEAHWAIRDARTARNRGVAKYHERMLREFSKKKDEDRTKRMEALKNNDVDRYREMLLEQQTNVPGDAAQRYTVLASFLSQTEEYLHKLGGKITAAKNHQEVEDAANAAVAAARSQGLSEEEVKAAAACAGEEVLIRNKFSEINAPKDSSSVNKYYNLAHAVNERVTRQPSMLRAGTLRDYQLVGLQWMLSLYNNKLNGILADEMGLGKTVQVMALIAYLMEFKGNYGPHLIIVPNAVLVNWKSELHNWLPSVACIFYVGAKEQRLRLFSHEVRSMKFNVLVTTYEFVMYDRTKLSKINWKYIIIDEAQRMKDRESVLARDLDRYHCQRRLLLTGTPLQNDLKELWSLLNLLLPEVFDNRKAFHDWFSKPFQKDGSSHNEEEDDWLETEKKVIIIHRLHQILEPFMLRRRVEDVEGSLPRKVSIVLRCRMSAIQGAIYDWIKSTGTIKVDPEDELHRVEKNPMYQVRLHKNLNNKCMELRKTCNHPLLNYPYFSDFSKDFIVKSCGKLWILDRVLIKLHRAGHRVLLFSTMTKLLDILEEYLQWRGLVYRRIDGTTSLEDRESAIVDFNRPDSDCFIFLLSIRAAGRGLNLQSADTVVIYDPDPNPQNEEQAVARAHRIGQKREVKVIYMEAVVDKISSYQKEDEFRNGGMGDLEDDLAGKDRYMGSIESLIRNNIQQYKIDMADEVINAGRFDQRTTHEERRMTLETLLHDDERYQETLHDVPSLNDVNRMIARSEEEVELFDQMDEEFDWTGEMTKHNQVPKWLRAGSKELNAVVASLSKKPSKNILASSVNLESSENFPGLSPSTIETRRERPKRPTTNNYSYRELDDEDGEDSDVSSEERNAYSFHEEEGEFGDFEDEEFNGAVDMQPGNKEQTEEEGLICDGGGGYEFSQVMEGIRSRHGVEEAASSGSSSGSRRWPQPATPCESLQKFGSLSALDARPKITQDDLEEGEIAVSGDSHMDLQQSISWNHERDDVEDEQVLQPAIKRKRSARNRPRYTVERPEDKFGSETVFSQHGPQLPLQVDHGYDLQSRNDAEFDAIKNPYSNRHEKKKSSLKQTRSLPSRRTSQIDTPKSDRLSYLSGSSEEAFENSRESWNNKALTMGGASFSATRMSDSLQRKCKNVISKLLRRIDKDGYQIVPFLYNLWKRNDNSSFTSPVAITRNPFDLRRIDQRVENCEYNGVGDFIEDIQLVLKNAVKHSNYMHEVRCEARKLHDMFFDIMKIAFPDTDFREARSSLALPSPLGGMTPAASAGQIKRPKADPIPGTAKASVRGPDLLDEGGRAKAHPSKPLWRPVREPDLAPVHPGDLVICKKKRKDRDKSRVVGPASPMSPGWAGPLSPPSSGRAGPVSPGIGRAIRAAPPPPQRREAHPGQQQQAMGWFHQSPGQQQQQGEGGWGSSRPRGGGEVQWAKPVKRVRTDAGKRRPSHL